MFFNEQIKSVVQLITTFKDNETCIKHLEAIRWRNGNVISPFDENSVVWKCKNNRYQCKTTGKYFNVKTATMFDNTKIELQKWFVAIWLVTGHKKGISSYQLAKELGITQKSAWFMLSRIRACFGIENYNELEGTIEADETFYGGKNKNRHNNKKAVKAYGRDFVDKVPILGMIERGGKMTAIVIKNTKKDNLQPEVRKYVKDGSVFIADDWVGYGGLNEFYDHRTVKDISKGYHNDYDPETHTNNIEGSWKLFKNSARDNYNHVSRKHIQWYVDEFVFKYNTRQVKEMPRVNRLLEGMEVRTKYKTLTNG
jgi:transposase-like protein